MCGNTKPLYSVLTYIIGNGYEMVHEIKEKSDNAEYLLLTDNPALTSSTWTVVCVENPYPEDPFYLGYQIRFNPFDFVNTDVVVRVDGSMGINKSLDKIVDDFNAGAWDMCVCIHPTRDNLYDEYCAWVAIRDYDRAQAEKVLSFIQGYEGYDVMRSKGLYQYGFMIQRKNEKVLRSNEMTLAFLRYLAADGKYVERVDQTIGSFVLNKYFPDLNILPVDERILHGPYITNYAHNSDIPLRYDGEMNTPYLFGREITTTTFE